MLACQSQECCGDDCAARLEMDFAPEGGFGWELPRARPKSCRRLLKSVFQCDRYVQLDGKYASPSPGRLATAATGSNERAGERAFYRDP